MDGPRASGPRDGGDFRFAEDEAIDVSRYRAALRRGVWLIVLIVVPLTVMVLVLSLVLPKTYESRGDARI